ncbi:hypothetical protein KAFR_0F00770 [Kazachstania africana CBS 2517]|uniref:Uncharacterized protein n=1 Tax=Kazachstania africana (strain ATCC 22294 / BCRC 22015 / CBS 2517 / CECT 1963 / NBRC 1671 / NRRL Y-8276) TaxID=1071382 RepID=H2AWC4_KAZAF|nr:hypothetical protein KAFR_0F00770 [Kazachstania africana CBS 2517]CCF58674.1 hypothetical protein KAFR_0F00770 [Kazachstania africana CBS 2517]
MSNVTGKLSNRVMNMKFMKFSNDDASTTSADSSRSASVNSRTNNSKFHDNSEWYTTNSTVTNNDPKKKITKKFLKKKPMMNKVVTSNVSFTTLKQGKTVADEDTIHMKTLNKGRMVFGDKKRTAEEEKLQENENDDDDYELDKMFKASLKKNKKSKK